MSENKGNATESEVINNSDNLNNTKDVAESTPKNESKKKSAKKNKEKDKIEALNNELAQEKDKFLRLFAEFENYKKRTTKERIELFKTAGEGILVSLLPVLDDLDRALNEVSKTKEKELLKGVELIKNKLNSTLEQKGLALMVVKIGDAFDAEIHEAITQIPAPDKKLVNKIVDVVEKGYKLGDKIIRFPKVVTGK